MSTSRTIARIIVPQSVVEGAGVRLKRSIATRALDYVDPFLLLDHFDSKNPADYEAGFPLHPHRGIETVTYLLAGEVHHRDNLGNAGAIRAGDVQWMTAGRSIMHEEMPQVRDEGIAGFQLWVNLPAKLKMTRPRYQNIAANEIPVVRRDSSGEIRVVAGNVDGVNGPVAGIAADPIFLDVALAPQALFAQSIAKGHSAFAYLFQGGASFAPGDGGIITQPKLVLWNDGDHVEVRTAESPARFLLVAGKPLNEPVARYGRFVMNTSEEIEETLAQLRQGTFG